MSDYQDHIFQPSGYVPTSVAEYKAAKKKMHELDNATFVAWKAANLKTPERVIQDHWTNIAEAARLYGLPPELLGGSLLNEMRALMNEDIENDLIGQEEPEDHGYFSLIETLKSYKGALYRVINNLAEPVVDDLKGISQSLKQDISQNKDGAVLAKALVDKVIKVHSLYPSVGIAQLRPDTILQRDLWERTRKVFPELVDYVENFGVPTKDDPHIWTQLDFQNFDEALASPLVGIALQGAHLKMMSDLIKQATWGIPRRDASLATVTGAVPVRIDGQGLANPSTLSSEQIEQLARHLKALGYIEPVSTLEEWVRDGYAFYALVAMYVDGEYLDVDGNPLFFRKGAWGIGVMRGAKDIRHFVLANPPDWDGFVQTRRLYDEQGYYGSKGLTIDVPAGKLLPDKQFAPK